MIQVKKIFEAAAASGAFKELAELINAGTRNFTLGGAVGGAKSLAVTAAILAEEQPAVVLTPTNIDALRLFHEISFYLDLLAPSSREIFHLPDREVDPYRGLSPHHEISANRAQALWHLLQDSPNILIASVKAAAVLLPTPEQYFSYCLMLKHDDEMPPDRIQDYLIESGYVEDDPVTDPGEFSLRGGILDIFPPHMDKPVRLEFFGDTIESLRVFDP